MLKGFAIYKKIKVGEKNLKKKKKKGYLPSLVLEVLSAINLFKNLYTYLPRLV